MVKVNLKKEETLILVLDFLKHNGYVKALHALEQESDVSIESLGRELAFLRTLILDGQWEDVEAFINPMVERPGFEAKRILFYIRKQKFEELLYDQNLNPAVVELVDNLKELEDQCSKEEFHNLCYCVTLGKLTDHPAYRNWTPFKGRLHCFESIRPFFDEIYPMEGIKDDVKKMTPNRLLYLLKQSMLYQLARVTALAPEKASELPNPVYLSLLHDLEGELPTSGNPDEDPPVLDKNGMLLAQPFLESENEQNLRFVARGDRVDPDEAAKFYQSLDIGARRGDNVHPLRKPNDLPDLQLGAEAASYDPETAQGSVQGDNESVQGSQASQRPGSAQGSARPHENGSATGSHRPLTAGSLRHSRVDALRGSVQGSQPGSARSHASSRAGSHTSATPSHASQRGSVTSSQRLETDLARSSQQGSVAASVSEMEDAGSVRGSRVDLPSQQPLAYHGFHPSSLRPTGLLTDSQVIRTVAFTSTGDQFAVGSNSKTLRVCNTFPNGDRSREYTPGAHFQVAHQRDNHHLGSIYTTAWNPSSLVLGTGSNDRTIKLIHFTQQGLCDTSLDLTLTGHSGTVRAIAFAPGAPFHQLVSVGNGAKNIRIWDASTGQCVTTVSHLATGSISAAEDPPSVNCVSFTHDGSVMFTGGTDCAIRVWDFRTRECVRVLAGTSAVSDVDAHPSAGHVGAGYQGGESVIWDLGQGCSIYSQQSHRGDCHSISFSPDGQWLLTGGYDSLMTVTNTQDYTETSVLNGHTDKVTQCVWHPTLPMVLSCSVDRTVRLWQGPS